MFEWIFDPYDYPFWIFIFSIITLIIVVVAYSFSAWIKFVYPTAKFEAIGNPFIDERELGRLVESNSLTAFKDSLNALKDYNVEGDNTYEVQRSLDDHFIQTIEMMRKDSSKEMYDFFDVYFEKLDVYLVKNELKKKIWGKKIDETVLDEAVLPITREFLNKLMDSEIKDLQLILKNYGFGKEIIDAVSDEKTDFLAIDTAIDKHVINRFKQVKVPRKCEKAKQRFVNSLVDILNIKNVLRAKQLGYDEATCKKLFLGDGQEIASWKFEELTGVEHVSQVISGVEGTSYYGVLKDSIEDYDKEGSVQILENALDGLFLKLLKDIAMQNYTNVGPTIRFLVSKEFEIKNLKIISKGVGEKLSPDFIKGSLITGAA